MKAACADRRGDNRAENAATGRCEDSPGDPAEIPASSEAGGGNFSGVLSCSVDEAVGLSLNAVGYDCYGKPLAEADTGAAGRSVYPGLANDTAEGHCVATARVYNPSLGRWPQQDPAGFAGGDADLYRYVACDVRGQFLDDDGNRRDA